jgi:hypothetical protein
MAEAQKQEEFGCETCKMRLKAEEKPKSIAAWFWRWHTKWCPGWKAYQKHLAELEQQKN